MHSEAVEDYLKAIYTLTRNQEPASTSSLATRLGVSAPAVSAMLKRLSEQGLVEYVPYHGTELTTSGRQEALRTIRRHRVLELFLVQKLGYDWDQVHDEAERLEHVASDHLIAEMTRILGEPEWDPHGAPIPGVGQTFEDPQHPALADLEIGRPALLRQVNDEDPALLRYLVELGLVPGVEVEILGRAPFGGPLRLRVGTNEQIIGQELSQSLRVEPVTA